MVTKAKPAKDTPAQDPHAFDEAKEKLLAKAKKNGKIDQRDIFALIPDTPDNIDVLDSLYSDLAEGNWEIISATEPNAADFTSEWAEDEEEEIVRDD